MAGFLYTVAENDALDDWQLRVTLVAANSSIFFYIRPYCYILIVVYSCVVDVVLIQVILFSAIGI